MLRYSFCVPLTTRPCTCEISLSSVCSSLRHWASSVAPNATERCQAPGCNWIATLFTKIQAPRLQSGVLATKGMTGYLVLKIQEVSGKQNLDYRGTVDTSATNGNFGTLLLDPADITITPGGAVGGFTGQVLSGDASPTTISQNQLQALPGNTNVVIQATNTITIQPLQVTLVQGVNTNPAGGTLAFQIGSGSITFQAGGAFTMAPGDLISANGRPLTITAGSISAGRISTGNVLVPGLNGGSINLTAK